MLKVVTYCHRKILILIKLENQYVTILFSYASSVHEKSILKNDNERKKDSKALGAAEKCFCNIKTLRNR